MAMSVLIVGFGPFPGAPVNPSGRLAARLARRARPQFAGLRRNVCVLPTTFAGAEAALREALDRHRPDIVLMFGLAARTKHLRIEALARNALSDRFPDAAGRRPLLRRIEAGAAETLRSRAPQRRLLAAARRARVPVRLSADAGRYICNLAYWRAMAHKPAAGAPALVQFVHVPRLRQRRPARQQAARPGLDMADLVRAGEAVLVELVAARRRR